MTPTMQGLATSYLRDKHPRVQNVRFVGYQHLSHRIST
jgi:hypothetical protein